MTRNHSTRRNVCIAAGSVFAALGTNAFAATSNGQPGKSDNDGEISHVGAAIHQEVGFAANPARVYHALTDAKKFDEVVRLSAAMNSGMTTMLGTAPTQIDAQPGGAFSLFGGYVTGRTLELVVNTRIVQAWRAGSWDAGMFSIAHFVLMAEGKSTRLVFDHTGFPDAAAAHLAEGWHINYWEPLAKALA
jgi:activator of HSP90 ATPase